MMPISSRIGIVVFALSAIACAGVLPAPTSQPEAPAGPASRGGADAPVPPGAIATSDYFIMPERSGAWDVPSWMSAISAAAALAVTVITFVASRRRSAEAQVRSDVDTFRLLRSQFLSIRETTQTLPKNWARFAWSTKAASQEHFEALSLYWINAFDEWIVTSGVIARKGGSWPLKAVVPNNTLWANYYEHAIKKAMDQCPTLLAALLYAYDESSRSDLDQEFVVTMWCLADATTRDEATTVVARINASVGPVPWRYGTHASTETRDYLVVPVFIEKAKCTDHPGRPTRHDRVVRPSGP